MSDIQARQQDVTFLVAVNEAEDLEGETATYIKENLPEEHQEWIKNVNASDKDSTDELFNELFRKVNDGEWVPREEEEE